MGPLAAQSSVPGGERKAAQELGRPHRLLAGALQLDEAHRALPARDRQPIVEHLAGPALAFGERRTQHLDALALARRARFEPGAGKRRQPADEVVHLARGLGEIDARLRLVDLCRVGHARGRLRHAIEQAALQRAQRAHHEARAALGEHVVQLAGRHVGPDGDGLGEADGAGIEPLLHAHHHHRGVAHRPP